MDIDNLFAVDVDACDEGVWFNYDENIKLKIRSVESEKYQSALENASRAAAKGMRTGVELPKEVRHGILRRAVADHLVVDWKGMKSGGKNLSFSPDVLYKVIAQKKYATFYGWIIECAGEVANFEQEKAAEEEKN